MRVPLVMIGPNRVPLIEKALGDKLRVIGQGDSRQVVFQRNQWERFIGLVESDQNRRLCEASALVLKAFSQIMSNYSAAKATPEGRMAIISAVMSLYNADPAMGSRLMFALNM